MLPIPTRITQPTVLVVEGEMDRVFFEAILKISKLSNIEVRSTESKDKTLTFLKSLKVTSGFDEVYSIGIVRDADQDPDAAFRSVCSALRRAGLAVPKHALQTAVGSPNVTVMILSGDSLPGMLETLCLKSFAENPAVACVDSYLECLADQGIFIADTVMPKAKLQVFLASKMDARDKTGLWLKFALQRSWWPWEHSAFDDVKRFLHQLAS